MSRLFSGRRASLVRLVNGRVRDAVLAAPTLDPDVVARLCWEAVHAVHRRESVTTLDVLAALDSVVVTAVTAERA